MKEYHASVTEKGSTKQVLSMQFLAENDRAAVQKIIKVSEALDHPTELNFVYHEHQKTLNPK